MPISFFGKGQSKDPDPQKNSRRSDVLKQLGEKTKDDYPDRPTTQIRIGQTLKNLPEKNTYLRTYEYLCDPNFLPYLWVLIADLNGMPTDMDNAGNPVAQLKRGQVIYLPNPEEIMDFDPNEYGIEVDATEGFREELEDVRDISDEDEENAEPEDSNDERHEVPPAASLQGKSSSIASRSNAPAEPSDVDDEVDDDDEYEDEDDDDEYEDEVEDDEKEQMDDAETIYQRGPVPRKKEPTGTTIIPHENVSPKTKLIPDELVPPKTSSRPSPFHPTITPKKSAGTDSAPAAPYASPSPQGSSQDHPDSHKQTPSKQNAQEPLPAEQANPYANFSKADTNQSSQKVGWMRDYEKQLSPPSNPPSSQPIFTDPLGSKNETPMSQETSQKGHGSELPDGFAVYRMRGIDLRQVVPGDSDWREQFVHLDLAPNARIRTYISDSEDDFAIVLERVNKDASQAVAAYEFHNDLIRLVKQTLAGGQQISRINLIRAVGVKLAGNDLSRNWKNYLLM